MGLGAICHSLNVRSAQLPIGYANSSMQPQHSCFALPCGQTSSYRCSPMIHYVQSQYMQSCCDNTASLLSWNAAWTDMLTWIATTCVSQTSDVCWCTRLILFWRSKHNLPDTPDPLICCVWIAYNMCQPNIGCVLVHMPHSVLEETQSARHDRPLNCCVCTDCKQHV